MTSSKQYHGGCHCSDVEYKVTVSPPLEEGKEVSSCNCSICAAKGLLHIYPSSEELNFVKGLDALKGYQFKKEHPILTHYFCPTCGTSVIVKVTDPENRLYGCVALNVRTIKDDLDMTKLTLKPFNGRDMKVFRANN